MPPLSTSNYGKGSPMATSTDLADRITAVLASAHAAIGELNSAAATGAPVNQASVNTLTKVLQDLGDIATGARQAAVDEAAEDTSQSSADASRAATTAPGTSGAAASQKTASTSGSGTAKS
jgi:septal ring-binding cell division protein DamX